jgi:hypothetical protein
MVLKRVKRRKLQYLEHIMRNDTKYNPSWKSAWRERTWKKLKDIMAQEPEGIVFQNNQRPVGV